MSDVTDALDWDEVLGEVEKEEEQRKKEGKSDNDFEAIPKGPYNVIVQEAEKMVASTGKDMIKVKVAVTEGPYANRTLFKYLVFGSKTDVTLNKITLNNLAAFGVTREYIVTQKPSIAEIAESLVGLTAIATVGIQGKDAGEYEGNNEIKGFRALEGTTPVAPPAASNKPGVPVIPQPVVETAAPTPTPSVPTPSVPVPAAADAADPFEG